MGDVAILMQAGFSLGAAVRAQLLTACSAMLGTVLAVATGESRCHARSKLLNSVTAAAAAAAALPRCCR